MSDQQPLHLDTERLKRVVEVLRTLGAAANEADCRFEIENDDASREAAEDALREAGYDGGRLGLSRLDNPQDEADIVIFDQDRFESSMHAEQAWRRSYHERWHDRVERRVDDWLGRLNRLRSQMQEWATSSDLPELTVEDKPPAIMSEELMRRFDVGAQQMPVFEFRAGPKRVMRFQPKGLWVIGANGRIDLITRSAAPILVDRSEPLSQSSDWQLYDPNAGHQSTPLTADSFRALLRASLQ
ncbi:hypothetical protein Q8W71_07155 [Methylobacterium sp. NEAU 140]|uniref:hypothetical protein n=1 Tax=Methylobacterium sp. NEAU 140 TaxID=3064945 RepID=UPI002736A1BD|nr:hypothetical protein [Methylobacterium sp. NEAU 140]MDP4022394.1 hypothetical protein [Methylobacterium sp. NEAU 140]